MLICLSVCLQSFGVAINRDTFYVDVFSCNSMYQFYNLISQIISRIFDGSEFQSFKECYGTRLITGFARLLG